MSHRSSDSILRLLLPVLLLARLACGSAAHAADEPLRELIELLDDPAEAVVKGEAIYGELTKAGAVNAQAAHALALLCTRAGKFERAVALLTSLPVEEKRKLPVMRLRLWLALELDEKGLAANLIKFIGEDAAGSQVAALERIEASRWLGGIAAILPDSGELKPPTDPSAASAFRSAQQAAGKRRQQLTELVEQYKDDKPSGLTRLAELQAEKPTADAALQEANSALTAKLAEHRAEEKETTPKNRELNRGATALRREAKLPTPGQPSKPQRPSGSRPTEPSRPSRDSKGNISPAEQARYENAVQQYQFALRAYNDRIRRYEEELRTYPTRLEAWKALDQQRRAGLQNQMNAVQAELATLKAADAARDAAADALRQDFTTKQATVRDLDLNIRLLRLMIEAPGAEAGKMLTHPSSYDLLSFPAERQRLLQSLRSQAD